MSIYPAIKSIRRFFRLLRDPRVHSRIPTADTSVARTAKDALHVTARVADNSGFSSTGAVYKHIADGAENYAKSFEKKDG